MPREASIVAAIVRSAKQSGWWVMKIHGGPHQLAGVPDLLCLRHGQAVFLEVKQPGKKATRLQAAHERDRNTGRGGVPRCHQQRGSRCVFTN